MMFNKVAIVGVGLIGGSLGLTIRRKKLARRVIGVARHSATLKTAKKIGAIDSGTVSLSNPELLTADLVILAVPPEKVAEVALKLAGRFRHPVIFIDVASTKQAIVSKLDKKLPKHVSFVGAHPMAGSERSGIDAARVDLYEGALCVLTPTRQTSRRALKTVQTLWTRLGSRVVLLSPDQHDARVAQISHLPHLAASALALTPDSAALALAACGFADTTRIAAGDPELWAGICATNRPEIVCALRRYREQLQKIEKAVARNDRAGLLRLLKSARQRCLKLYR